MLFRSLSACADLLERHGGHPAAGGFTVRAERIGELQERLEGLAQAWLSEPGSGLPVRPEALLRLNRIDRDFWQTLRRLEPFGIGHPAPVFWSAGCEVVEQRLLRGGHLQLQLSQDGVQRRAMAWRWTGEPSVPRWVDVAFRLRMNRWQGKQELQLEVEGLRASGNGLVVLRRRDRTYWCRRDGDGVVIRNSEGQE